MSTGGVVDFRVRSRDIRVMSEFMRGGVGFIRADVGSIRGLSCFVRVEGRGMSHFVRGGVHGRKTSGKGGTGAVCGEG